jgi:hypothetical protein
VNLTDSATSGTASVDCTGTKKVVGGGFLTTGSGEIALVQSYPSDDNTWTVTAFVDNNGDLGAWSITAYALCTTA